MKYSYLYSGSNAAFVFSDLATFSNGVAALVDEDVHKQLQKNKFAKHLLETGELEVEEIADDEPKAAPKSGRGGKGGKQNDAATDAAKAAGETALAAVKSELTGLGITFSEDESLEQLQAKLSQAKE